MFLLAIAWLVPGASAHTVFVAGEVHWWQGPDHVEYGSLERDGVTALAYDTGRVPASNGDLGRSATSVDIATGDIGLTIVMEPGYTIAAALGVMVDQFSLTLPNGVEASDVTTRMNMTADIVGRFYQIGATIRLRSLSSEAECNMPLAEATVRLTDTQLPHELEIPLSLRGGCLYQVEAELWISSGLDMGPFAQTDVFGTLHLGFEPGVTVTSASGVLPGGNEDADGDGVGSNTDNCLSVANAAQLDADSDGFGNACDADLNNDCSVNVRDLGLLRAAFFSANPEADFNGDGVVNVLDLGILRSAFFNAPGPSALASCNA